MIRSVGWVPVVSVVCLAACQASTMRPGFAPVPSALSAQIELDPPVALDTLLAAFRRDNIVMAKVEARDGFFDSGWLASPALTPTTARPLGPAVVRIRGWVDLGKPYHSRYTVETVHVPAVDPSREGRELEVAVPDVHPASVRVRGILSGVLAVFGDPEDRAADSVSTAWVRARLRTATPPPARPDTTTR